ncbi:MAG: sigma-70 family RNA polymerase sigma factor [bacterium]
MEKIEDKEERVIEYLPYVYHLARQISQHVPEVDIEDLAGYGKIGLVEASQRFDPKREVKFTTFAYYRIKGAIYDGLRKMGWIPRSQYKKLKLFEEGANQFLGDFQESKQEVIKRTTQEEAFEIKEIISSLASIYIVSLESLREQEGKKDKDFMVTNEANPHEIYETKECFELLKQARKKLSSIENEVIELYYYQGLTFEAIGERLGFSKSWTSRIHTNAIKKLNQLMV